MTKKASTPKSAAKPATPDSSTLQIESKPNASQERMFADLATEGLASNVVLMRSFGKNVLGETAMTESVQSLRAMLVDVHRGDLRASETLLMSQAVALNTIFAELARRAGANMGEYMDAAERYMRLALKAQGQCRATLETLATVKNPPSAVFAKQANFAQGPQQVNNGPRLPEPVPPIHEMPPFLAPAGTAQSTNKLLGQEMANGWTPERRARQAELIRTWRPWERSTGPVTEAGKLAVSQNAWRGGTRALLQELAQALREQAEFARC